MTDNISINFPKDGSHPYVDGTHAVGCQVETRTGAGECLQVRLTFSPVGEDALHGGGMIAEFTLTKPEFVPNAEPSMAEQAAIGSDYARLMVEAAQSIIGEHLSEFVSEGLAGAIAESMQSTGEDDKVAHIASMCMMIASVLIVQAGGDKELAKANADISTNPELLGLAVKSGMDPKMVGLVTETVRSAIDVCDVS